jgi:hypothetical protein
MLLPLGRAPGPARLVRHPENQKFTNLGNLDHQGLGWGGVGCFGGFALKLPASAASIPSQHRKLQMFGNLGHLGT